MSEGTQTPATGPPPVAHLEVRCAFLVQTLQAALDAGVNGFAVQLLAESMSDDRKNGNLPRLAEGGVMFNFPVDHQKRPVWVIVTNQPPFVKRVAPDPERPPDRERLYAQARAEADRLASIAEALHRWLSGEVPLAETLAALRGAGVYIDDLAVGNLGAMEYAADALGLELKGGAS